MRLMLQLRSLFTAPLIFSGVIILFVSLAPKRLVAQNDYLQDSLKKKLSLAGTDAEKVYVLLKLASYYSGLDNDQSGKYATQALEIAELSRDRQLIIKASLLNGDRLLNQSGLTGTAAEALENFHNAEQVARESGLDDDLAYSYISLARASLKNGEYDKALNYDNLALSIVSGSNSDSLKVEAYNSMGNTYEYKNEELLAFRNYLEALNIAELSKKDALLQQAYDNLSDFYSNLGEMDKSIDYQTKILNIDKKNNDRYALLTDYNGMGRLFRHKKEIDLALSMYEHAIVLADSLRYPSNQLSTYLNIANLYFDNNEVAKGMEYLNSHPDILGYFRKAGLQFFIDEGMGWIYSELGQLDSGYYFLKRAEPEIERKVTPARKYEFYIKFAYYYKRRADLKGAIGYYLKARDIGVTIKNMYMVQDADKYLDSLYNKSGDYKTAYNFNTEYNLYKDSIKSLSRETDLLKLEVESDNRRRERLAKEEEENTQRRHNIQYMGFTAGLAGLFIALVMAGLFVVSPRTIRALGFFSFIFLFEFIILLADKRIHEWTHGEPWMILCIKIFLAAILLPLHHWLEHKVIHYLTHRKKFTASGVSVWARLFKKETIATPQPGDSTQGAG
jgi:tetratricopeptide (TPR) repeat protein